MACPAYALSPRVFEIYRPEVFDEYREPTADLLLPTEALEEEGLEELILLDREVIEELPAEAESEVIESDLDEERSMVRILLYSVLTQCQQTLVRRIVLECEDMEEVARGYGVTVGDISLAVSLAIDQIEQWSPIFTMGRIAKLGRALGF